MFYMIVALIIWASSFTAGKYAYQMFDPAVVVLLRLSIAAAIVLPLFIRHYHTVAPDLRKKMWGISFLIFPIGILMQFIGLGYTSASSAVTVIGTEPILVLLLGFLLFGKKVAWYDWILSVLAFLGIVILGLGSHGDGTVSLFGLTLVLLAGIGFTLSIYLGQSFMEKIAPNVYTSIIFVQGVILCLPLVLILTKTWQIHFSWSGLFAVIYLGVGCSWLAYKLWNIGLTKTPTHISGMLIALEPVFGVIIAMLVLGERMNTLMALGSVLVIGSAMASTIIPILLERYGNKPKAQIDNQTQ
ncbi:MULTISPECIES: DMT family transporter [unclassified Acinetobacter]|uniref:DMT family transporter n=1 Tax=unclassified Acinetobacter TaxID=196816 RepID=UPI0035B9B3E2